MEKTFEFIDSTSNDKFTRRLARSHAMKGKNTGKTHHRRSRLDQGQLHKYRQSVLPPVAESRHIQRSTGDILHSPLGLTSHTLSKELLSISFPVEATAHSQRIINQCKCFTVYS